MQEVAAGAEMEAAVGGSGRVTRMEGAGSLTCQDQQWGGEGLGRGPLCGGQQRILPRAPSGTIMGLEDQHAQRPSASKALTSRTCVSV